jgi:hypothetical protein
MPAGTKTLYERPSKSPNFREDDMLARPDRSPIVS